MLLSMLDFENKIQSEIAQVKGLKGGNTSGWVKVTIGTEDKIYLYDTITELKNVLLQRHANCTS